MRLIGVIALLSLSIPAHAGIEQAISQCANIQNSTERLGCFDAIANGLVKKVKDTPVVVDTSTTAPAVAPIAVATTTQAVQPASTKQVSVSEQVEDFGIQYKVPENAIEKIYYEVGNTKKSVRGIYTYYFTNGQVWKQAEPSRYKMKKGERVYIEKAALGSFILGSDDRNGKIRVKRLK